MKHPILPFPRARLSIAAIFPVLLFGNTLAHAQVVPTNGSAVSNVGSATLININRPDANKASYNQFSNFEALGVVLNNATKNTDTKLIGGVKRNEALGGTSANLIILDNIGNAPTKLNGLVEIAGQAADLVMVGKNGVICNSCGFINTNNLTLGAGTLSRNASGTYELDTNSGQSFINITGAGLSAPDSNVNLVAEQIKLLSPIYGKDVAFNIVRGVYGIEDRTTRSLGGAFDAQLGDYVGVPNVLADGDITIYTNARKLDVTNLSLTGTGNIFLSAESGAIDVTSGRWIANGTMAFAADDLSIKKTSTDSRELNIVANNLQTYGMFSVASDIDIKALDTQLAASSFDTKNGMVATTDSLSMDSVTVRGDMSLLAQNATLSSVDARGAKGEISANQIAINGGRLAYTGFDISDFDTLALNRGTLESDNLVVNARPNADVSLTGGTQLIADKLEMNNIRQFSNSGDIALSQDLVLDRAASFQNEGGIVARNLRLSDVTGTLSNTGNIKTTGVELTNVADVENSGRWSTDTFALAGTSGTFRNAGDMIATTLSVANSGDVINAGKIKAGTLDISNTNRFNNLAGAQVEASTAMTLGSLSSFLNQGRLVAQTMNANSVARIENSGNINVKNGAVLAGGQFSSQGNLWIESGTASFAFDNDVTLTGQVRAASLAVDSTTAQLTNLALNANDLRVNTSGKTTLDNARIQTANSLSITADTVEASRKTLLNAPALTVDARQQAYDDVELSGNDVALRGSRDGTGLIALSKSRIQGIDTLALGTTDTLNITQTDVSAADMQASAVGQLNIDALSKLAMGSGQFTDIAQLAQSGNVSADALVLKQIQTLDNSGTIQAKNNAEVSSINTLNNSASGVMALKATTGQGNGTITNAGQLAVDSGRLQFENWTNQNLLVGTNATLEYTNFVNQAGAVLGGLGELTVAASAGTNGSFSNSGQIDAVQDLALYGRNIDNKGAIQVGRNLQLGRQNASDPAFVSFTNYAGLGSVTVGRDFSARVDKFDSAATFSTQTDNSNSTIYAPSGRFGVPCAANGVGSCRDGFNVAGGATLVWYGSGGVIPVFGKLGRDGATVQTTTVTVTPGTYQDAPIRVGGNFDASGQASNASFNSYAATLDVAGNANITGYASKNTNAFEATSRNQIQYFTDEYKCYSDVACVNPGGNNQYEGRVANYAGLTPTDTTTVTSRTGGLRTVALSAPTPSVSAVSASAPVVVLPTDLIVDPDLSGTRNVSPVAPAAVITPQPSGIIVPPTTPQQEVKVSASNFVFPTIPGELPVSEKLPVISDTQERAFDFINPARLRDDRLNRSCYSTPQGEDSTSLNTNSDAVDSRCIITVHTPKKPT
ncbi:beta strand repeat-containing protein [Bordetella avium]|uniref:beta strand repeat-containing protein n=1 Tax=Bordetella avium TaxID=521 RepID=UPI001F4DCF48|nr:hemolysin BL-binding protein [Bordetella avium]